MVRWHHNETDKSTEAWIDNIMCTSVFDKDYKFTLEIKPKQENTQPQNKMAATRKHLLLICTEKKQRMLLKRYARGYCCIGLVSNHQSKNTEWLKTFGIVTAIKRS